MSSPHFCPVLQACACNPLSPVQIPAASSSWRGQETPSPPPPHPLHLLPLIPRAPLSPASLQPGVLSLLNTKPSCHLASRCGVYALRYHFAVWVSARQRRFTVVVTNSLSLACCLSSGSSRPLGLDLGVCPSQTCIAQLQQESQVGLEKNPLITLAISDQIPHSPPHPHPR